MSSIQVDANGFYYRITNKAGWAGADPNGYYQGQYRYDNPYLYNNAEKIYAQLLSYGWDRNSISAVIGNMARESALNAGQTQIGYEIGGSTGGFGLVMWSPQTKFTDWCRSTNHNVNSAYWQIWFINNRPTASERQQFNENNVLYPMTFNDFIHNTGNWTVEYLTRAWLACYERAGVSALNIRLYYATNYANEFYDYDPQEPIDPDPAPYTPRIRKMPLWMMIKRKPSIIY